MNKVLPGIFAVFLLNGCSGYSIKPDTVVQPQGVAVESNPSRFECSWMPATKYMFGAGYQDLLTYEHGAEWYYPIFVGAATISWAAAAPVAPAMDLLTVPLRIGQTCPKQDLRRDS